LAAFGFHQLLRLVFEAPDEPLADFKGGALLISQRQAPQVAIPRGVAETGDPSGRETKAALFARTSDKIREHGNGHRPSEGFSHPAGDFSARLAR
jgi:hypothetical protein